MKNPISGDNVIINKDTGEILGDLKEKINVENGEKSYKYDNLNNKKLIIHKDPKTGKEDLIDKDTGEKIDYLEIKYNKETSEPFIINKKTNEIINNLIPIINPETGEEIFINKNLLHKENNNDNNIDSNKSFEIIIKKDPRSNEEIYIDKNTGIEINNIERKYDEKSGENILINKETGDKINGVKIKIDNKTGEEIYIKDKDKTSSSKELICIKDPRTNKEIFINKNTGEKLDNIKIDTNENGDIKLINKDNNEEINDFIRKIDNETGKEIFILKDKKDEKFIEIIPMKDKLTGKDILINKNTGEKLDNFELIENKNTGEIRLFDKETGEEINNIKIKKDNKTNNNIIITNQKNILPKRLELISLKDNLTGKEFLINKNTGEKLDNIEKVYNKITNEPILINRITGEKIVNFKIEKDPINQNEIYVINNKEENNLDEEINFSFSSSSDEEINIIKDKKTGKEMILNQRGEKLNIEKDIDLKTGEIKFINKENKEEIKGINKKINLTSGEEKIKISKETLYPEKKQKITLIKDPRSGKDILINLDNGEQLKNLDLKVDENNNKFIIDKNTLEVKSCLSKIDPESGKEIFYLKEEKNKFDKSNNLNKSKIDIICVNDEITGNEILINKKTGEEIPNIKKVIAPKTKKVKFLNTNNNKEIDNIIIKKDLETGEEYYSINKDNILDENNNNIEIINIIDPRTGKEIFINKNTGEEINNIEKKIDNITGLPYLIDKETKKEIKGISIKYDENEKEIFIKKKEKLPLNQLKLICIKDPRTGDEILINKENGEEMKNLEKKIDSKNGEIYIIDKDNNEEIKILKSIIDENGDEIFLIRNNINDDKLNEIEIVIKKNIENGEEQLINKETGNIITNIEKIIDNETGEEILVNKETGEKIENLIKKINPITKEEIYSNKENLIKNKEYNQEFIIKKDNLTGKVILINRNTGEKVDNLEIKINPISKDFILYNNKTGKEMNMIKKIIAPITKEEILVVNDCEKNNIEIIIEKDNLTGKEILINKNTGEKLDNFEIKINPKTKVF